MTREFKINPYADSFPIMEGEDWASFVADIGARGLIDRIIYRQVNGDPEIVDGRNRFYALKELGKQLMAGSAPNPAYFEQKAFADDVAVNAYIYSVNVERRHMKLEDRKKAVVAKLKADPTRSDSLIAKETKSDRKTVRATREKLIEDGEIPILSTVKGKDGKIQPRKSKPKSKADKPKMARVTATTKNLMAKLILLFGSDPDIGGKPFTVSEAVQKLGKDDGSAFYIDMVLRRMEHEPIHGYRAISNGAGEDAEWTIVPVAADPVEAEPVEAIPIADAAQAAWEEADTAAEVQTEEPAKELGKATRPAPGERNPRTPFEVPHGSAWALKMQLQRVLKGDLTRRLVGVLAEVAHKEDDEMVGAVTAYVRALLQELDAYQNSPKAVLATFDKLTRPSEDTPEAAIPVETKENCHD